MKNDIRVWDLPIRLFHWLLAISVVFLWYSARIADDLMQWHMWVGQFVLALLVFRIIWGFIGSETARFAQFVRSPFSVITYFKTFFKKDKPHYHGHNPAGGWMVVLMLLALLLQAVSGLFMSDDIFYEGPLYQYVSEELAATMAWLHQDNVDILMVLIGLHVTAIVVYLVRKENLITPMITGKKK
jgi:cytochrome b